MSRILSVGVSTALLLLFTSADAKVFRKKNSHETFQLNNISSLAKDTHSTTKTYYCGCLDCTEDIFSTSEAGAASCGERIQWLQNYKSAWYPTEEEACAKIAGVNGEFPSDCGPVCDPARCERAPPPHCGCEECISVWDTNASGHTCGERIDWLQTDQPEIYPTENDACTAIAGIEFPEDCSACDPSKCGSTITQPSLSPTASPPSPPTPGYSEEHPFGQNVIIIDPSMTTNQIQTTFDTIWDNQRNNEMGTERYSLFFMPGAYGTQNEPLMIKVGYYTEVAGLGPNPESVQVNGKIEVYNRCFEADPYAEGKFIPTDNTDQGLCFALNNFWRSLSNLSINIISKGQSDCRSTANFWAISQASSIRRVDIKGGDISLMDYCSSPGYASGGYMADSRAKTGKLINGSQQQWLSRNIEVKEWDGAVWNQAFLGVTGAPDDSNYPDTPFTTFEKTPLSREKPFLFVNDNGEYNVRVPSAQTETSGITWADGALTPGRTIPIADFFIVKPTDSVNAINENLEQGKHLIFTPGVYDINESILVQSANTVVLGLGQATLTAVDGCVPLVISDNPGIIISGMTVDAGTIESPVLLQVGTPNSGESGDPNNPTTLHDMYFRIGGPHIGKADISLEVNSNNVLIDHTWVWRADHGVEDFDLTDGFEGDNERWEKNIGRIGVQVNGDDVTVTGLFIEHYQEHQLVWNGQGGRVYFYQSELPYEPLTQEDWMTPDGKKGWASYKVGNDVTTHELWSAGVYCYNRNNPDVVTENAFEAPADSPGVKMNRLCTRNLSGPGSILSVINGVGGVVDSVSVGPNYVVDYLLPFPTPGPSSGQSPPTGPSPNPGPVPNPGPSPTSQCANHDGCAHLDGACCPNASGIRLSCCTAPSFSPAPLPSPIPTAQPGLNPGPGPPTGPGPSAQCANHAGCAHLEGACCPTAGSIYLSCCMTPLPSSAPTPIPTPVSTLVPTPDPTIEPTPIPTTEPTPIPTPDPTPDPTPEPTPEPTPGPTPIPTPIPTPDATVDITQCANNSKCDLLNLSGACCPTSTGTFLSCCMTPLPSPTPAPTPISINPPTGPGPSAQCANHAGCAHLEGACCPTADSIYLSCCITPLPSPTPLPTPDPTLDSTQCTNNSKCSHLSGACCPTSTGTFLSCCDLTPAPDSALGGDGRLLRGAN